MTIYYSTDSEEHLINTKQKEEPQWDELTSEQLDEELADSWDMFMGYLEKSTTTEWDR